MRLLLTSAVGIALASAALTACGSGSTGSGAAAADASQVASQIAGQITAASTGSNSSGASANSSSAASTSSAGGSAGSGGSGSGSSNAAGDPCALATAAQIQALFGGTVADGTKVTTPDVTNPTCTWLVTGSNLGSDGDVVIALLPNLADPTKFGYAKTGTPGAVDVPGVGDSAFYKANTAAVNLLKGKTALLVQGVFGVGSSKKPDPATIKTELIGLATGVAAKV